MKTKCRWYEPHESVCENKACPYYKDECYITIHPDVCRYAMVEPLISTKDLIEALKCCADSNKPCDECVFHSKKYTEDDCYHLLKFQSAARLEELSAYENEREEE